MTDYSSSTTFERKTFVGQWWLPGHEHKCYGSLSFEVGKEQKLCIIGSFKENVHSDLKEYEVIHGLCVVDKKIKSLTIFHAWETHSTIYNNDQYVSETIISFSDVWIGDCHYNSQDSVNFKSFNFGLNNLENWLNIRDIFTIDFDKELTKISSEMNIPKPILFFTDKNVSISIGFSRKLPESCLGQTESTMYCCPGIHIKANSGTLRYYGDVDSFSFYISWVFHLFELLMSGHTFPFNLNGNGPIIQGEYDQSIHAYILDSRDITVKQRRKIQPQEILFPYQRIQTYLPELSVRFQQSYLKMGNILGVLCSSLCTSSYNTNSLLNLLFTLEGLQQLFYPLLWTKESPYNKESYEAFERCKESVLQKCDTNALADFVKKEINWHVPFGKRLHAMLLDMSDIFTFLDNDICEKVACDLKNIRNAGAHCDLEKQNILQNYHMYFLILFFVQFLQIAIILKSCGLSTEVIKECLESSYPSNYRTITEELKGFYISNKGIENG